MIGSDWHREVRTARRQGESNPGQQIQLSSLPVRQRAGVCRTIHAYLVTVVETKLMYSEMWWWGGRDGMTEVEVRNLAFAVVVGGHHVGPCCTVYIV